MTKPGPKPGSKKSEAHRAKIALALRGNTNARGRCGSRHTEETRQKIAAVMRGRRNALGNRGGPGRPPRSLYTYLHQVYGNDETVRHWLQEHADELAAVSAPAEGLDGRRYRVGDVDLLKTKSSHHRGILRRVA